MNHGISGSHREPRRFVRAPGMFSIVENMLVESSRNPKVSDVAAENNTDGDDVKL